MPSPAFLIMPLIFFWRYGVASTHIRSIRDGEGKKEGPRWTRAVGVS